MIDKFVIVFIDDVLVYSSSLAEHYNHVQAVLAEAEKCEFHRFTNSYMGYVLGLQGMNGSGAIKPASY